MNQRLLSIAFVLTTATSACADTFTFNFNSLSSGATSAQIQTYMNGILGAGKSVVVTGAVADTTYNGEGYVVGPGNGSKSLTLGNTDGATASNTTSTLNSTYDTFLSNTNDSSRQISQKITMKFSGLGITSLSFDFEVFPDGSGQTPDFQLWAGNNSNGIDPPVVAFGTNGIQLGVKPGTTNGTAKHSPNHQGTGNSNKETTLQYISTSSGTFSTPVTELDFVDWPATIGIDNLVVGNVPEPASVFLFGGVALAAGWMIRKRRAA